MMSLIRIVRLLLLLSSSCTIALLSSSMYGEAFTCPAYVVRTTTKHGRFSTTTTAETESDVPTEVTDRADMDEINIPKVLPSAAGKDYVPLATMLATGQLAEADQFTRDALIELSGAAAKGRQFVYFTDVKNIPSTDLATIERLWNQYSNGKFGYSIQKKKYNQSKENFEVFCRKVGWTVKDSAIERKKRWFGASEFIYDLKKAPEGHLPLTSALRGTSLLKHLLNHPVWDNDDWKKEP